MTEPSNPEYEAKVRRIFAAPFITDVGIELARVEPGRCESRLSVAPRHAQQDGFVHAGVLATVADHTAGAAAGTLVHASQTVLTVEFKINLLRPARGAAVVCRASVLRAGRTLSVVESEAFTREGERETLVAKATVTLAIVDADVGTRRT